MVEISIWMVGEMLDKFPSSKASKAGMGFLNQSTCFGGKNYFDSMVYCCAIEEDVNDD